MRVTRTKSGPLPSSPEPQDDIPGSQDTVGFRSPESVEASPVRAAPWRDEFAPPDDSDTEGAGQGDEELEELPSFVSGLSSQRRDSVKRPAEGVTSRNINWEADFEAGERLSDRWKKSSGQLRDIMAMYEKGGLERVEQEQQEADTALADHQVERLLKLEGGPLGGEGEQYPGESVLNTRHAGRLFSWPHKVTPHMFGFSRGAGYIDQIIDTYSLADFLELPGDTLPMTFHRTSTPRAVMDWVLAVVSVADDLVVEDVYRIAYMCLSAPNLPPSHSCTFSVAALARVAHNWGVDLSRLKHSAVPWDLSLKLNSGEASGEEGKQAAIVPDNLIFVTRLFAHTIQAKPASYSSEELQQLLVLILVLASDKTFLDKSADYDVSMLVQYLLVALARHGQAQATQACGAVATVLGSVPGALEGCVRMLELLPPGPLVLPLQRALGCAALARFVTGRPLTPPAHLPDIAELVAPVESLKERLIKHNRYQRRRKALMRSKEESTEEEATGGKDAPPSEDDTPPTDLEADFRLIGALSPLLMRTVGPDPLENGGKESLESLRRAVNSLANQLKSPSPRVAAVRNEINQVCNHWEILLAHARSQEGVFDDFLSSKRVRLDSGEDLEGDGETLGAREDFSDI